MDCEREHECLLYLWSEMEPGQSRDFSVHLEQCPTCKGQVEALGPLVHSMQAMEIKELPEALARHIGEQLAEGRDNQRIRAWFGPQRVLAVAASMVLLLGIGILWLSSLNISSGPVELAKATEADISDEEYVDAMVLVLIAEPQGFGEDLDQAEQDIQTGIEDVTYQIEELLQEIEQDLGPLEPNSVPPPEQGAYGAVGRGMVI